MARAPLRTFRAPDELWTEVQELAAENGEPVSEILRRALEAYREAHREEGRQIVPRDQQRGATR